MFYLTSHSTNPLYCLDSESESGGKKKKKENAWRWPLSSERKGGVAQTFTSHSCPPRPDSRTPAASLMRGWNTPPLQTPHILSSIHLYSSLLVCPQPQSSWPVICDLPVCGCNKVSTQLRIHFPGTCATNHRLESPDTHAHKLCLGSHTNQAVHKWQHEITNHRWRRKGNY